MIAEQNAPRHSILWYQKKFVIRIPDTSSVLPIGMIMV